MNIYETIKNRYSVRAYRSDPIPEEKLKRILEAAHLAPSAHNAQEWKFIVVKELETRKKLAEAAAHQNFIATAPVIIAGVALNPAHIMTNDVPAYAVDLAIALDHLTLAAVEEGLGTCWIGAFDQNEVKKILAIPEKFKVVALMPLGYPNDKPTKKFRKPLEEVVSEEKFPK